MSVGIFSLILPQGRCSLVVTMSVNLSVCLLIPKVVIVKRAKMVKVLVFCHKIMYFYVSKSFRSVDTYFVNVILPLFIIVKIQISQLQEDFLGKSNENPLVTVFSSSILVQKRSSPTSTPPPYKISSLLKPVFLYFFKKEALRVQSTKWRTLSLWGAELLNIASNLQNYS